ncbi:hypothetical protein [Enterococcus mundtii]|uniref:Uncharacterized protein n=1 Tax=Enterococcus mundtii TaxID=53346 RepID=A0A848MXM1_ENTMU|nr:hypothetical protein [Enterococcus mundtii]NMP59604.1 hypothetical protein [Enterococcus mundtii]
MKKIRIDIETCWSSVGAVEYFKVEDDGAEEEIVEEAKEIFYNYCNYGYEEVQ